MGRREDRKKDKKCPTCGIMICNASTQCRAHKNYKHGRYVKKPCLGCGKITQYKRCRSCSDAYMVGENHSRWKGGKRTKSDGYVLLHHPEHPNAWEQGYILEHRVVMEEKIGRYLLPGENVHHINGVKNDNRIENLELWTVPQPTGVRVSDEIERCIKFLELHNIKVQEVINEETME